MNVTKLLFKAHLLLVCLLLLTRIYGQTAAPPLNKPVHVPVQRVDIDALGDIITQQTGFILSFNAQKIGARQQVQLRKSVYTVQQLLALIKTVTDADYSIYKEHVIFHRRVVNSHKKQDTIEKGEIKQVAAAVVKAPVTMPSAVHTPTIPGRPPKAGKTTARIAHVQGPDKPTAAAAENNTDIPNVSGPKTTGSPGPPAAGITTKKPIQRTPLLATIKGVTPNIVTIPPVKPGIFIPIHPILASPRRGREKPGLFHVFGQAVLAADETFYVNAQAKAGITLLYGIAGWSSNFSVSGFWYGLGSSFPLRRDWRIQLEATTGKLSKATTITEFIDTIPIHRHAVRIENQLHRLGLFVQKGLHARLAVHAGLVFNYLKITYYLNETPTTPGNFPPGSGDITQTFYLLKPAYTFNSAAFDKPENIRTWIGLQAGLSYRF